MIAKKPPATSKRQLAASAVGSLDPGVDVTVLTEGDFDFTDAIERVTELVEADAIDLIVWTANSKHVERLASVAPLRVAIDNGFFLCRPPEEVNAFKQATPEWRAIDCHLKAAIIRGSGQTWTIRSSANLNPNRRSELMELSDDPDVARMLSDIIDSVFLAPQHGDPEKVALSDYDRSIPWMHRAGLVSDAGTVTL